MRVLLSDGSGLTARQCAMLLVRAGPQVGVLVPGPLALARATVGCGTATGCPATGPTRWAEAALAVLDTGGYDVLLPTSEQVAALSLLVDEVTRRGVATTGADLAAAVPAFFALRAFELGGVLIQQPVPGPLLMVQAVFDRGRLLAASAARRDREGASGGASHKSSVPLGPVTDDLERLGTGLVWHGALSLDVIDSPDGPVIIDVNPRLVEPGNAAAAGLDLLAVLLDVAVGQPSPPRPDPKPGVRTHQLLLALLAAAATPAPRHALLTELAQAATATGPYRHSREELTPLAGDPLAAATLGALSTALIAAPGLHTRLATSSVANYALTPDGWNRLITAAEAHRPA